MPSYRFRDAFLSDQQIKIAAATRRTRREALAVLVGQEMVVPDDADPNVALDLAVHLAQDKAYNESRRELYNWQEDVIQREQSSQDDAQDLVDLMSKLHRHVEKVAAKTRRQWLFFILKWAAHALEVANPASWATAVIEGVEFLSDRKREIQPGPIAAFQHVRRQVIAPARTSKSWWRR